MDPEIKLDPSTHLQWDRHGYRADLLTHPSFSLQNLYRSVAPKLNSMYEAILDYFVNHMTPDERVIAAMDGFEAINHVFRLISGEWLNIFHIIESDLTKLAFQREAPRVQRGPDVPTMCPAEPILGGGVRASAQGCTPQLHQCQYRSSSNAINPTLARSPN